MGYPSLGLTGEQIRAARALARIEQAHLAQHSGLSLETIKRLERIRGPVDANSRTLKAICEAFERLGIFFDGCEEGGVGVCLAPNNSKRSQPKSPALERREAPPGATHRLIYHSRAMLPPTATMNSLLDEIAEYTLHNEKLGITGAIFECNGRFLQALEGSKDAVRQVFGAISADPRHEGINILDNRGVATRQFDECIISCGLFDTDQRVLAKEPALEKGFDPSRLSPASALGLLSIMRDLEKAAPRNARGERGKCRLAEECLDQSCAAAAGWL